MHENIVTFEVCIVVFKLYLYMLRTKPQAETKVFVTVVNMSNCCLKGNLSCTSGCFLNKIFYEIRGSWWTNAVQIVTLKVCSEVV